MKGTVPVSNRCKSHPGSSSLQGPHLCSIHPRNGCEGKRIFQNKEITEGDDSVSWGPSYLDPDTQIVVQPVWQICSVSSEYSTDHEHANSHAYCTIDLH
jgi:hypothetical protein